MLDLLSFGAVGDGHADDTDAIKRAIAALKPGATLRVTANRVFCHSEVLTVSTPGVTLSGSGTLRATAEATSAVRLEADRVTLAGVTLEMASTSRRWSAPDQHKLFLGAFRAISVHDVIISGSAAAGIFLRGSNEFTVRSVTVRDTRADGIHATGGSSGGTIDQAHIERSGDDGVAVVSYVGDHAVCRAITITRPRVDTTTGGRGISVVGGQDISYSDIDVTASNAAAVYVACEGGDFVTMPTSRVQVTRGRVSGANSNPAIDHGAVLVYSGRAGGSVSDVTVSGLTITGTRATASRQIGVVDDHRSGDVAAITFRDITLAAAPEPYQGTAPVADVDLVDVTAAGTAVKARAS